jgi:ubiquinone/menaquinone biosynthesis C-methylase UbiE
MNQQEDHSRKIRHLSQQRYGSFAQSYVNSTVHAGGSDLDLMLEVAHPGKDWQVLDIATGGGHTAGKYAPHVAQVIALDLTHEILLAARDHLNSHSIFNVTYAQSDSEHLPLPSETMDLVTCRLAAHHFADCPGFLTDCSRVARPGGIVLIVDHLAPEEKTLSDYIENFERLRDPSHNQAFPHTVWLQMFSTSGLEVFHTEHLVKRLNFDDWVKRQRCTPETRAQLINLLEMAPGDVRDWMQPQELSEPSASFAIHFIVIAGVKTGAGIT